MSDESNRVLTAASHGRTSFLGEVLAFLRETRKWWLAPVFICLLLLGALIFLGGTGAGPFIYTLF